MSTSTSPAPTVPKSALPLNRRIFPNGEWALLAVVACECLVFGVVSENFFTVANFFEIVRLSVELGLLALALTPIIITGGIDLSVGSALGLSAVVLGALWRDAHVPLWGAIIVTLLVGCGCGLVNGALVGGLNLPSLIVTLGTFSLYRGIADGLTRGIENYSGFGHTFLFFGQGYIAGVLPPQLLVLVAATLILAWILQRTPFGRTLYAIGFSAEGSRFAGVPVRRRLALIYVASGLASSLAGVIYVAHLGQAKSDAGTGYELSAITAVVLGGASIFGGRGTVLGTILGLYALVVLQNGLRLGAMPAELTGVLTGVLLVATVALHGVRRKPRRLEAKGTQDKEFNLKNSQVAVLSGIMLLCAVIVAGSNWVLVRSIRQQLQHGGSRSSSAQPLFSRKLTIAMMPKAKGDPYFISCEIGAEAAAKELGDDLIWDGPTDLDPAKQNEVVEAWITRGVDAIAVSVENKQAISTVLRKARARGIPVLAWDADAEPDARDFFINQATPQGIGYTLTDEAARILNGHGDFAIVTASLTAANQNEWIKYIKERLAVKYPDLKLVTIQPSEGDRDRAFAVTQNILKVYPQVKVIMAIAAPAVPGAAEAVKQSQRKDVKVTGLSLPNMCKPYVKDGTVEGIVLWNTIDLGYLTVEAAHALVSGDLKRGDHHLNAGRLGTVEVDGDQIMLGRPFVFNKSNIDQFDF